MAGHLLKLDLNCSKTIGEVINLAFAAMAELVDALDSGSSRGNSVDVRVILAAKVIFVFSMPHSVVIIANGEFSASLIQLEEIRLAHFLIAVDGGIDHCWRTRLQPHLLVGDFDSVSAESLHAFRNIPRVTLLSDKDKSDLEVALEKALEHTQGSIQVFGAGGGRTDHFLYNLHLLTRYAGRVTLESQKERVFVICDFFKMDSYPGQTISLLPLSGPVKGISSQGLKWELCEAEFDKHSMSLSNICLGNTLTISVSQGNLLCCLQF